MRVTLPDGTVKKVDTALFGKIDQDTIYVRPGQWAKDWFGSFTTVEVVLEDSEDGGAINLKLAVNVNPVNDAPFAANKVFDLANGSPVVLARADFGFVDPVEHDGLKSVIVTSLPSAGKLMLNGVEVTANTEIAVAELDAGHLSFVPSQTQAGSFDVGFHVRDTGGTVGPGAADTSVAENHLTFNVPKAHLGDFVWEDTNGNGVQDSGEAGLADVVVELKDGSGNVVASTKTDANGKYHFDVNPGTYSVTVQTPNGYAVTTKAAGGNDATDSDIDAQGNTASITLTPGETNNKADAGLVRPVSLGSTVWYDTNRDGIQNNGETGVAGVKVTLLDASGQPTGVTATIDANGHYQFNGLKPGSYSVQFDKTTLPTDYLFTAQGQGGDAAKDSDADVNTGTTAPVTLNSGDTAQHLDAGIVVRQATVGDRVWEDSNGNGQQDSGEQGIDGALVSLKDASGKVVSTVTTHDGGQYSFTVDPGTYSVSVSAPNGYVATSGNPGDAGTAVSLKAGQTNADVDFGYYRPASLGDKVWIDANRDGVQDAGEAGVAGVKVVLLDASGKPTGAVATTDASGNYSFNDLKPGTYSVQFDKATLPANYGFTTAGQGGANDSDANVDTGLTAQLTLASGDHNTDLDAGLVVVQGKLGDRVWEDKDGNGVQDAGEQGVDGAVVTLKAADGHVVSTVTTHDGGQYSFTVDPGTYSVSVAAPDGYVFTGAGKGGNGALDSDVGADGNSTSVSVTSGSNNVDLDAGVYRPATLSEVVWIDANRDGRLNNGEVGAAGVKVTLLDANGNPVAGAVATTDANGHYQFDGLAPGSYSVQFDKASLPAGYNFTSAAQGGPSGVGSDADTTTGKTAQVTLASGDNLTLRAGLIVQQATLGDRVWEDSNGNGVQDSGEQGLNGVTVDLKDSLGNTVASTVTHDGGQYSFTVDPGTYSIAVKAPSGYAATAQNQGSNAAVDSDIDANGNSASVTLTAGQNNGNLDAGLVKFADLGDTVWNDANRNGLQDAGESGRADVKVTLLDASGAVVATTTTDTAGHYLFDNLKPGVYSVQFDKASLGDGYQFTTVHAGNAATDSDADVNTGLTQQVTLTSGSSNRALDAGVTVVQANMSSRVWEDKNGNGVQDAGEAGIVGAKVELKDESGKVVATTSSGTDGKYTFTVDPGKYSISVTAPAGATVTSQHSGSDSAIDSDIGSNGQSDVFTLSSGNNDAHIDAGYYKAASLGNRVWLDGNGNGVQDSGEAGVAGVKVLLLDANGTPTGASAVTDGSGSYSFSNLKPGTYSVQFDTSTLPANYVLTTAHAGSNGAIDSDANRSTGVTQQVTLNSGDSNQDLDAGIVALPATIGDRVWHDTNGNGVQDSGEQGVDGVVVTLKNASGGTLGTVTTHDGGQYSFTVDPGTYTVSVAPPAGYVFTAAGKGGNGASDSDVNSSGNVTVSVGAGEVNQNIDAGIYRPASLSEIVWIDSNRDGRLNNGEVGAAGIKVTLLDASGNPVPGASAVTDASGHYQFSGLAPGVYSVQFDKSTLPAGYNFTSAAQGAPGSGGSDADTGSGKTGQVTLSSGDNLTVRAGLTVQQGTLGDRVWEDSNGNGVQDSGEAGIDGVKVDLKDSLGNTVASTVSHDGGQYSFTVDPGTYSIAVTAPTGYGITAKNQGSNTAVDSDIDAAGKSGSVTLTAGQSNTTVDAGLYKFAELGDVVWNDANRNGVQDSGETGRAGVKVTLLDAAGKAVATTTTDVDGHYLFNNLKPGAYSVQFDKTTLGTGYAFTSAHTGTNGNLDSDADVNTGVTQQVTLTSGGSNHNLDAGVVALQATIGDRVWEDKNGNGIQDTGETGLVGVKVDLKDEAGNIVKTTTTGTDGKYSFTVDAGKYAISVTAPGGMFATTKDVGSNDAVDSDINAGGQSDLITVTPGQSNVNLDAGLYKGATLGDRVWLDTNRNGLQDTGELGLAGVKVILLDQAGNPTGVTATTDANGSYSFTNLKPGTYSVQFDKTTLPTNYIFTSADQGSSDAKDSDANVTTGKTAQVTLTSGQVNNDLDAGVMAIQAKLGDTVWEDKNGNGVQDSGESGLCGVTVQLKDATGKVVATTTTDSAGHYTFTADPGSYTVSVTAPSGYSFTTKDAGTDDAKDSDFNSTGVSNVVKLAAAEVNNTVDAGLYKAAAIGDRVWLDSNKNGLQDCDECGVAGVKVILLDADGKQVGNAVTTDCDGNYMFSNLKPGVYTVQFDKSSLPEGMTFTKANQGTSDSVDSDVDANGLSHSVTLVSGQTDKSIDAGVLAAATIGDKVWIDKNGNGLQDDGSDSGKAGVTVELRNAAGNVVKTTTTDANGNYKFSVEAGTYSVSVKAPTGYTLTTADVGSDGALDSDADASGNLGTVTVAAGQNVSNLDAGLYQKASIGDKVWYDTNGDGIKQSTELGAANVTVSLLNEKGVVVATDVTDSSGNYLFSDLGPGKYAVKFNAPSGYMFTKQDQGSNDGVDSDAGANGVTSQFSVSSGANDLTREAGLIKSASIGNLVWEDSNYNGVQDAGEAGVDGVTVKLYDANNVLKATTVTHDGGQYQFTGLAAGSYQVEVTNKTGYYFTKTGAGTSTTNSDITSVSGSTGRMDTITLAAGQDVSNKDAGVYRKASIGDKVWRDANHNGVQDSGEEGIGGISVSLFDTTTNKQVGSTIKTDASGNYKFADLNPGTYYLVFDKTNVTVTFASDKATYNMSNWKWGMKNVGSNDAIDSDVVGDGKDFANVTHTDTITLTSGKNDMSWDATITPIAIDLNGDGIHTIAREAMTGSFDLLGTGKAIQTGWLSASDGFLAIDSNGNGSIDDISELFGGAAKGSGFAKLETYDSNHDGVVDAKDAQFASLRIWQDANSNGKTDAGELMSLEQAGVASLKVSYVELPFVDANNNVHLERSSVVMSNGQSADMTDVYFNVAREDAQAAGVTTSTIADLISGEIVTTLVGQNQISALI
ncbi:SdrD B-like domain-containing protein [Pseudoduganella danionis]|uniref:SdrD B-like domain-containing protein n=1 Tax=Pseudoduganella danionis TaxID=1890295 RepID=UPI0035B4AEC2